MSATLLYTLDFAESSFPFGLEMQRNKNHAHDHVSRIYA
jgi:hypothetical protein